MSAKIVVAEDEKDIGDNLRWLLTLEGYEVWVGANGREALQLIHTHRPDLVISDVMMPEMTGHELIRALRADPAFSQLPCILLTARSAHPDVREGMNLGADDYLTKPFQRAELLKSIASRLERARDQRRVQQQMLAQHQHRAHHDATTELPNRGHFLLLLNAVLGARGVSGQVPLLVGVGLDNLPQMQLLLQGAEMGACVAQIGQRMRDLAAYLEREAGTPVVVARTAEDRFVFLLHHAPDDAPVAAWLEHVLQQTSQVVVVGAERHFPRASVGGLVVDNAGPSAEPVLGQLEIVMSQAQKVASGLTLSLHRQSATDQMRTEIRLYNALHEALDRGQIHVAYQPQVRADGRMLGFESLMRWTHPDLGPVSPGRFIPLAEDGGQIVAMGRWILGEACQQAARWRAAFGLTDLHMSVNLSLRQFAHPDLFDDVVSALECSGLPASQLELEVTEGTAMLDHHHTLQLLNRLDALGVRLAIDDFGTGYSSLTYLKRFPLDVLKLDQSFVRNLCTSAEDRAISKAVIQLAHSLDMEVIAEGVEEAAQRAILETLGSDHFQGYLYGRPMSGSDATDWLGARVASSR